MNPLTCIITDDEPLAVRLLESFVTKTPDLQLLGSYTDSVEAIAAVKEKQPNLLFLDIQMPDINGMELAHMVPQETRIIFTTAFQEYAFESYEVSALDFLLKPIRYGKFLAAVEKARQWFGLTAAAEAATSAENTQQQGTTETQPTAQTVFLKVDGEYRQVAFSDILYVSGMKDYVMFYTESERKPLITHMTMKAAEELLPSSLFMRVNRSYIVALNKIRSVDRNDCLYIGNEIIRVTDAYKEAFAQYMQTKTCN
jgi:DNA-binding LytR/AlgR family response regulator